MFSSLFLSISVSNLSVLFIFFLLALNLRPNYFDTKEGNDESTYQEKKFQRKKRKKYMEERRQQKSQCSN